MPQEFEKEYAAQGDLWGKGVEGVNQKKNQYTFNITESSSKKLWGFSLLLILAAMIIIASLYFFVFHSRELY
jgi:outer membrane receptor for Fe3+-dicitrate